MREYFNLLIYILLITDNVLAQSEFPSILARHTTENFVIDGLHNELAWKTADESGNFWQHFPTDGKEAQEQTKFQVLYSDTHLYVFVEAYSSNTDYRIQSLKRDFISRGVDNITLLLDPFSDATNGVYVGSNPYGVQREGQISEGGKNRFSTQSSFDIKWEVEATQLDNKYSVEFKIPFSQINFPENKSKWRFNLFRFNANTAEWSTWSPIPQVMLITNMAFMGTIEFEKPLGKSNASTAFIPYLNGILSKDYITVKDEDIQSLKVTLGMDAKVPITNGLTLDLTINPDFSQVEVDDEIVNLTRFEVTLPEKRQFFIQNEDLFSSYGNFRDSRPFFSRRIGIAEDKDGNVIQNRILAGLRLNGKLNTKTRIGLLNIHTDENVPKQIASTNNTVMVFQKQVFSQSNFSLLLINRQIFKDYEFIEAGDTYNKILGFDYNLVSPDNSWNGNFFVHKSFAHEIGKQNLSSGFILNRETRKVDLRLGGVYVGTDYRADLGFVRRTGVLRFFPGLNYIIYPKSGSINSLTIGQNAFLTYSQSQGFESSDRVWLTVINFEFKNQSSFQFRAWNRYEYLYEPFDPTGDDINPLLADNGYNFSSIELRYRSDLSKNFNYELEPEIGQFYNGFKYTLQSRFNLRIQPKFIGSFILNYNNIKLPLPHTSKTIFLFSSRFEYTFSRKLFWSSILQYNTQGDNFGINSRLQWRFAPLSDLYLVYQDTYLADGIFSYVPEVRSINLKLTFWLNL